MNPCPCGGAAGPDAGCRCATGRPGALRRSGLRSAPRPDRPVGRDAAGPRARARRSGPGRSRAQWWRVGSPPPGPWRWHVDGVRTRGWTAPDCERRAACGRPTRSWSPRSRSQRGCRRGASDGSFAWRGRSPIWMAPRRSRHEHLEEAARFRVPGGPCGRTAGQLSDAISERDAWAVLASVHGLGSEHHRAVAPRARDCAPRHRPGDLGHRPSPDPGWPAPRSGRLPQPMVDVLGVAADGSGGDPGPAARDRRRGADPRRSGLSGPPSSDRGAAARSCSSGAGSAHSTRVEPSRSWGPGDRPSPAGGSPRGSPTPLPGSRRPWSCRVSPSGSTGLGARSRRRRRRPTVARARLGPRPAVPAGPSPPGRRDRRRPAARSSRSCRPSQRRPRARSRAATGVISGLADATIVVEAAPRSGALITARWALEQGRGCFLVPGSIDAPASAGCLAFLREPSPARPGSWPAIPELIDDLGPRSDPRRRPEWPRSPPVRRARRSLATAGRLRGISRRRSGRWRDDRR